MVGLWADGWFYISSAGLLVSGMLFFFLLGQYRVASEAADAGEVEPTEALAPAAIRPVYIPDISPSAPIASHPAREAEPKPEPKAASGEYAAPDRRKDPSMTTGGISPAVVYLQNIKVELADLHKDLRALSQRVSDELASVSARDEALIERLGELTRAVEGMKAAAEAPAPAPEPEPILEVVVAAPEPAPVHSPDETIRMELGAILAAPTPQPEPQVAVAQQAEASPEPPPEAKPRRGPVWPV